MKIKEDSPASGNWTNAPDKVYLSSCMRSDFIKAVTNGHAGDIEYIRKDVLLAWAEDYVRKTKNPEMWCTMKIVINKLKSM